MVQSLNEAPSGHNTGFDQDLPMTWKRQEAEHVIATMYIEKAAKETAQQGGRIMGRVSLWCPVSLLCFFTMISLQSFHNRNVLLNGLAERIIA